MAATTMFELERRSPAEGKSAVIYAKDKRQQPARKTARSGTARSRSRAAAGES
jgi:hypothetical protein